MIPLISIRPDQAHRYNTGAGFVLTPALSDNLKGAGIIRVWNVYQGLTSDQDIKARSWSTDTGLNSFQTQAYRPSVGFSLPVWLTISLFGFGLLFAPLLALILRNEVRSLNGLASTLGSIGLSKKWIKPVFTTLTGMVMAIATITALIPALVTTVIFNALYPTAFDPLGAPWWILAGFLLGILAATKLATHTAIRGFAKKEHIITI